MKSSKNIMPLKIITKVTYLFEEMNSRVSLSKVGGATVRCRTWKWKIQNRNTKSVEMFLVWAIY